MVVSKTLPIILFLFGVVASIFSPSPFVVIICFASLAGSFLLLWSPKDLPILLLPICLQWLAVSIKPIQTFVLDTEIDLLTERGAPLESAAIFGFLGLFCMAIGMYLGKVNRGQDTVSMITAEARTWPPRLILICSLLAIALGHVLSATSMGFGPLRQVAHTMAGIQLAGLFTLTFWCLVNRVHYPLLIFVLVFETLSGMMGFFSSFKESLLAIAIAIVSARPKLNVSAVVAGSAIAALLMSTMVFWSAIKGDYRVFITQGMSQQHAYRRADVTINDRLNYLADKVSNFDQEQYADGFARLSKRQSYIDFLAQTMQHMPEAEPHTGGAQTGEAIRHILMPRVLFPNKPAVAHDTEVTMKYTGLAFTSANITSISIGYLGEFYADFGYGGALACMLIFGMIIGRMYRFIMNYQNGSLLVNAALAAMMMMPFIFFERALIKLIGATLIAFVAALLLQRIAIPQVLKILSRGHETFRAFHVKGPQKKRAPSSRTHYPVGPGW
ncbi:MAG: hypothetical protein AAF768_06495 [Pseudomonadota bacterium]